MQVKVPKFIEIEDKVVFGMTWKQFLAVGLGLGGGILANLILVPSIGVPVMLLCIFGGIVLAFVKVNERPFIVFLGSAWRYFYNPHSYIWKRVPVRFAQEKSISTTASPESGLRTSLTEGRSIGPKVPEAAEGEAAVLREAQTKIAEIAKLLDQ